MVSSIFKICSDWPLPTLYCSLVQAIIIHADYWKSLLTGFGASAFALFNYDSVRCHTSAGNSLMGKLMSKSQSPILSYKLYFELASWDFSHLICSPQPPLPSLCYSHFSSDHVLSLQSLCICCLLCLGISFPKYPQDLLPHLFQVFTPMPCSWWGFSWISYPKFHTLFWYFFILFPYVTFSPSP